MSLCIEIVHTFQFVYNKEKFKINFFDFDWLNEIIQ